MRIGEHTQGARHVEMAACGFRAAGQVINQQFVGVQNLGQAQGCPIARIEEIERGIGRWVWPHLEPGGRVTNPGEDRVRSARVLEFLNNGPSHARVERLGHLDGADQDEVVERTGIGNDDGRSARCFSQNSRILARSFSKSSIV